MSRRLGRALARGTVVLGVVAMVGLAALGPGASRTSAQDAEDAGEIFGQAAGTAAAGAIQGAAGAAFAGRVQVVRKNINDLADAELQAFRDAVFRLMERDGPAELKYQDFVNTHLSAARHGHGGPAFLPWHRAFLVELEEQLGMAIPYWDWTQPAPKLLTDNLFGSNGGGTGQVELTWTAADSSRKSWSIRRFVSAADLTQVVPIDPGVLAGVVAQADYVTFRAQFEPVHGQPHVQIGGRSGGDRGHLASVPTAVSDPIFFLLHSFVDKVWWDWQEARRGGAAGYDYAQDYWDGTGNGTGGGGSLTDIIRTRHALDSAMWPWDGTPSTTGAGARTIQYYADNPETYTPRSVLDISTLGYRYE